MPNIFDGTMHNGYCNFMKEQKIVDGLCNKYLENYCIKNGKCIDPHYITSACAKYNKCDHVI